MNISLRSLTLVCRQKQEVIPFSRQVTFFHGKMSAGKSTIARLIDYCLGARSLDRTTAVDKELISVELSATVGTNNVVFERTAEPTGSVQVSWTNEAGEEWSVLAPLQQATESRPLVGEDVFTFSDLMFYLAGGVPLRVRRSALDEGSPMVRLSFRDVFWYCYLQQDKLDNSFYHLDDRFLQTKSRYAIRFILGYYTERLELLHGRLTKAINERAEKLAAVRQIRDFLQEVGYASESDVEVDLAKVAQELAEAREQQARQQASHHPDNHVVEEQRTALRQMSVTLGREEQSLSDLAQRLVEFKSLKDELVTARQKLSRAEAATSVLSGVRFESCPQCGTNLAARPDLSPELCNLCGQNPTRPGPNRGEQSVVVRRDIESRLAELEDTIALSQRAVRKQQMAVESLRGEKQAADRRFQEALDQYDSAFVAAVRAIDREVATLEERERGLERFRRLPRLLHDLETQASQLLAEQDQLKQQIDAEQASLSSADQLVQELEQTYLRTLLAVGVPGVGENDVVRINRRTWVPEILEGGQEEQPWTFLTAGSNGKKTMLNVCYALAVHEVAVAHNRPLPTLLIIDHPMKCTSPDVNRDVFEAFYRHLYGLVADGLKQTQVILIDNDYFPASRDDVELIERYMTPDEEEHPPLITYYRGA